MKENKVAIEYLPIEQIKPHPKNGRAHSASQVAKIARSIRELGFTKPLVVDETSTLLAGHGTLQAARQLAIKTVPVVMLRHLSSAQKHAYMLADNRLAEDSTWDDELLAMGLAELQGMNFDLSLTGFEPGEIRALLEPERAEEEVAEPTLQPKAVARPGDLWRLGEHRLMCGDCTEAAQVAKVMGGALAAMIYTDPPYGVSYVADEPGRKNKQFAKIANDQLTGNGLVQFLTKAFKAGVKNQAPAAAWYIWHANSMALEFRQAMTAAGLVHRDTITWVKPYHVIGQGDYHQQTEPCFYAYRQDDPPAWHGDRSQFTVWRAANRTPTGVIIDLGAGIVIERDGKQLQIKAGKPSAAKLRTITVKDGEVVEISTGSDASNCWQVAHDRNTVHPTQKPVELARKAIGNSTAVGQHVLDLFGGSGSTLIACEQTGRIGHSIDLEPTYIDATIARWEELTKNKATLDGKGWTFDKVKKQRAGKAK